MVKPILSGLVLAALSSAALSAQAQDARPSLYVVENIVSKAGTAETQSLVRIWLDAGNKLSRETIITLDARFLSHFGRHRLIDGRYLVTAHGGVIDIRAKKVVHDEQAGRLLGVEHGKVVYRIDNSKRESGIFAFDLKAGKLEKLARPGHWALPGATSPDSSMSVEHKFNGAEVILHKLDGSTRVLGRGFSYQLSELAAGWLQGVPLLWVDNTRILSQKSNGKLVLVGLDGKVEDLLTIDNTPKVFSPPSLYIDARGRIIYSVHGARGEGGAHVIDVKNRKAEPLTANALGHDFDAEPSKDGKVYSVLHKGKSVGQWNFAPFAAVSADGWLAFPYAEPGENLGQPKGLAVWSRQLGQWRTLDMWVESVVGWGH